MKTAGMALMFSFSKPSPKLSSSKMLVKGAFFSLRNRSASATAALSEGSSRESEMTARPLGPYFRCISTTCGKFSLQGPQVVDQASTIVYFTLGLARRCRNWLQFRRSSFTASADDLSSAQPTPARTAPATTTIEHATHFIDPTSGASQGRG